MQLKSRLFILPVFLLLAWQTAKSHPFPSPRQISPGKTTYYIDPVTGNDDNTGTNSQKPWRSFKRVNQLILSPGDAVEIVRPGTFRQSLAVMAKGYENESVKIRFAPGLYDFFPDSAIKKQLHITNTNDVPYAFKVIALLFDSCRFVDVEARGAKIELHGKTIETFIDNSDHVHLDGLSFDYFRPTVSECRVTETGVHFADLLIHPDSKFSIKDSLLTWEGEGWSYQPGYYWQVFDPSTGDLSRIDIPAKGNKYVWLGERKVRVYFEHNPGFKTGLIYQNRDIIRDNAGLFLRRSKNVWLANMRLYFIHGMGVVSQYCENIRITHLQVKTAASSGRTCAAWADILHFSGCKGKIEIADSYLSAANDDAINIHGVHLKIMEKLGPGKIRVRFMHDQTYGFEAYETGDSIDLIRPKSLLPYASNRVLSAQQLNDKEILLTLEQPLPPAMSIGDVIENSTATPEVDIHHDTITSIPTRGILVTSRRKVRIMDNYIQHTQMSGIYINDDASNWYESGMVRDVVISRNHFYKNGGPVIGIHPENTETGATAVHSNINISENEFELEGRVLFAAKSTSDIKIVDNKIEMASPVHSIDELIKLDHCYDVHISGNRMMVKPGRR